MTKKFVKWIAVIIGLIVGMIIVFRVGGFIKNIVAPTPPPPPTVTFGALPPLDLPASLVNKNYSYTIDTVTGHLPTFPDRAKVFKIAPPTTDLLALTKADTRARHSGFTSSSQKIKDNVYQWTEPFSPIGKRLEMDIFSSEFDISSNFINDENIKNSTNIPSPDQAKEMVKIFLSNMDALHEDMKKDQSYFFSIQDGKLISTNSFADTKIIEINFFQEDLDKLPIYYPQPYTSTMRFLVAGNNGQGEIVEGNFFHQEITDESATYPIKTADEAYSNLKKGEAYVASPGKEEVAIQNVFLAYYMNDKRQDYVMPIVIFQGDNGFIAYVSAISEKWIEK